MELLTVKQVAKRLQLHPHTVKRYIKQGRIKTINITGRNIRITEKDYSDFLKDPLTIKKDVLVEGLI